MAAFILLAQSRYSLRVNPRRDDMSPVGASMYRSPHTAALQIDPSPGSWDFASMISRTENSFTDRNLIEAEYCKNNLEALSRLTHHTGGSAFFVNGFQAAFFRNPPAMEFSSRLVSHRRDAPLCCYGLKPPVRIVQDSRKSSPVPPKRSGSYAMSHL
jgi:hypothetical protein